MNVRAAPATVNVCCRNWRRDDSADLMDGVVFEEEDDGVPNALTVETAIDDRMMIALVRFIV